MSTKNGDSVPPQQVRLSSPAWSVCANVSGVIIAVTLGFDVSHIIVESNNVLPIVACAARNNLCEFK